MARINIEASAALAEMLALRTRAPRVYARLVRASANLPLELAPTRGARSAVPLGPLVKGIGEALTSGALPRRPDVEQAISENPFRTLANSIINLCWRNGPIEDIHAGDEAPTPFPLTKRRVSDSSDRKLMTNLVLHLTEAFEALGPLIAEQNGHARAARILAFLPSVWPSHWTLSEDSRVVELVGSEKL